MHNPVKMQAPQWLDENKVDAELAKRIHAYLNVYRSIPPGMSCLENVITLLKQWLQKKPQEKHLENLMQMSLSVSILTLPDSLTYVEDLDEYLVHPSQILRDWSVQQPAPCYINVSFTPTDTDLLHILQQIKTTFEIFLQFMTLVENTATIIDQKVDPPGPSSLFWEDVASANPISKKRIFEQEEIAVRTAADIKAIWDNGKANLEAAISELDTFLKDAQSRNTSAVHADPMEHAHGASHVSTCRMDDLLSKLGALLEL